MARVRSEQGTTGVIRRQCPCREQDEVVLTVTARVGSSQQGRCRLHGAGPLPRPRTPPGARHSSSRLTERQRLGPRPLLPSAPSSRAAGPSSAQGSHSAPGAGYLSAATQGWLEIPTGVCGFKSTRLRYWLWLAMSFCPAAPSWPLLSEGSVMSQEGLSPRPHDGICILDLLMWMETLIRATVPHPFQACGVLRECGQGQGVLARPQGPWW